MTQEQKELLLEDLSARLPYGVKILHQGWNYEWDQELSTLEKVIGIDERFIYTKVINDNGEEYTSSKHTISLLDDKPYLFPLSSMTDELWDKEFMGCGITEFTRDSFKYGCETLEFNNSNPSLSSMVRFINLLIKNHFDIHGLIPMGLAIDASKLNIY